MTMTVAMTPPRKMMRMMTIHKDMDQEDLMMVTMTHTKTTMRMIMKTLTWKRTMMKRMTRSQMMVLMITTHQWRMKVRGKDLVPLHPIGALLMIEDQDVAHAMPPVPP